MARVVVAERASSELANLIQSRHLPWPWLLLIYLHDRAADTVTVVAVHDARTAASATSRP